MAVAQDLPELESQNEFKAREELDPARCERQAPARRPDRREQPHPGPSRRHLAERETRGDRDRGPALLQAQGRRLPGHRARAVGGRPPRARRPGRLDDHPAVRQERAARAAEPLDLPEAEGGGARLPARAQVDQGQDPHRVPEHGLLRDRAPTGSSRRRASTSAGTTPAASRTARAGARAGGGGAARRHDRLSVRATARSTIPRRRSSAATSCSRRCATRYLLAPSEYQTAMREALPPATSIEPPTEGQQVALLQLVGRGPARRPVRDR